MARIGFIGVGNMGGPMARNLIKAGHALKVYDLSEEAVNFVVQSGAKRANRSRMRRAASTSSSACSPWARMSVPSFWAMVSLPRRIAGQC